MFVFLAKRRARDYMFHEIQFLGILLDSEVFRTKW